jgi:hypothetical protein
MCENPAGNPLISTFKKMLVGLVLPSWLLEMGNTGTKSHWSSGGCSAVLQHWS